ncbi:MAG: glucose 1-dehydrogenase [bacterium]|jgi:NAD(P)-dependent dehydrogenase (short-subunit alcohol dehydrogenase family)
MDPQEFRNKAVIVTGGGSGIGKAAALAFSRLGASVVVANRNREAGERTVGEIRGREGIAEFQRTDVTSSTDIQSLVRFAIGRFGRIDIAFNNAACQEERTLIADQEDRMFDHIFHTNARSVFFCMKYEIRAMLESGGGVIINNASVSGIRNSNPGLSLYSASKSAVISLTKSAAMEYTRKGIRINAIVPGRVETPMMLGSRIADMSAVAEGLPIGRLGRPGEIAQAVVWLASGDASFIAGHALVTDGGFLST